MAGPLAAEAGSQLAGRDVAGRELPIERQASTAREPVERQLPVERLTGDYAAARLDLDAGILRWRRVIGYVLGGVTISAMVGLLLWSLHWIHRMDRPADPALQRFVLIQAGIHAAITIAGFFLGYQLLRVSERLMLPHWLALRNPEVARILLGLTDVLGDAAKLTEKVATAVSAAGKKDRPGS